MCPTAHTPPGHNIHCHLQIETLPNQIWQHPPSHLTQTWLSILRTAKLIQTDHPYRDPGKNSIHNCCQGTLLWMWSIQPTARIPVWRSAGLLNHQCTPLCGAIYKECMVKRAGNHSTIPWHPSRIPKHAQRQAHCKHESTKPGNQILQLHWHDPHTVTDTA